MADSWIITDIDIDYPYGGADLTGVANVCVGRADPIEASVIIPYELFVATAELVGDYVKTEIVSILEFGGDRTHEALVRYTEATLRAAEATGTDPGTQVPAPDTAAALAEIRQLLTST